MWLNKRDQRRCATAARPAYRSPIPCQVVSNGEYLPPPQTLQQQQVAARIDERAAAAATRLGMSRRRFLQTTGGLAVGLLAMNDVYGQFFRVAAAEALDPAAFRQGSLPAGLFILDAQLHHVADRYDSERTLRLRRIAAGINEDLTPWNPALVGEEVSFDSIRLTNCIKEVFLDSDTSVGILSGITNEDPQRMHLTADELVATRRIVNELAGSQRLLGHGFIIPQSPRNLEEMQRQAEVLRIDSWKGYTISTFLVEDVEQGWRLDDERVAYPTYEMARRLDKRIICIHKGLAPPGTPNGEFGAPFDVPKAARDWPDLTFVIYHSAFRPSFEDRAAWEQVQQTGRIDWVTDLGELVRQHGLTNVYAELGTTFGSAVITYPGLAAHILGQLLRDFGEDRIVGGTDSIWYGSPQWQIEAFWRFQLSDALRERYGYPQLTETAKRKILGLNSARMYGVDPAAPRNPVPANYQDRLAELKAQYLAAGPERSNTAYGWVRRQL